MAGPAIAARAILSWALRGTKKLSPIYRQPGAKQLRLTSKGVKLMPPVGKKVYRPWVEKVAIGDKSWLGKMGIGPEGRTKAVLGYTKGYKHLKKHKKLYAAGGAGAAIWDFLPGKDNPKA